MSVVFSTAFKPKSQCVAGQAAGGRARVQRRRRGSGVLRLCEMGPCAFAIVSGWVSSPYQNSYTYTYVYVYYILYIKRYTHQCSYMHNKVCIY